MSHSNFVHSILFAATLSLFAASASADWEDRLSKSFQTQPEGSLVMDVDRGAIHITASPSDRVEVEVIRIADVSGRAQADALFQQHTVEMNQTGNIVQILSKSPSEQGLGRFWKPRKANLKVEYRIAVPAKFQIDAKTAGGKIVVQGVDGKINCQTSGGSLLFENIAGPIRGRTSGGSITAKTCRESVDISTSGGSIHVSEVEAPVAAYTSGGSIKLDQIKGNVIAKTSGGSISVREVFGTVQASTSGGSVSAELARQPEGDCSLKTSGGSINVKLAETLALNLHAQTSGGRVITDFPVTVQGELKKNQLKSKLNGGGPTLVLETSGGNVRIGKL